MLILSSIISCNFFSFCIKGQTQIRRVRLPRIADSHGEVSYEELVGLVIVFTFPEKSTTGPSGYLVSLTYYDVDG
jgi:hypothetical protein